MATNTRMVYINKGDHDDPHGLPKDNLEGSLDPIHHDYTHTDISPKMLEEMEKLEYICDVCSRRLASTHVFFCSAHGHHLKGTAVLWRWY